MTTPRVGQSPTLSIFGRKATRKQVTSMAAIAAIIAVGAFMACARMPFHSTAHGVLLVTGGVSAVATFVLAAQFINMSFTKPKRSEEKSSSRKGVQK